MNDIDKIIWTSASTLIGGVCLFVLCQLVSELLIKPYLRFRGIVEEISSTIIYRSGVLCSLAWKDNPDLHKDVYNELRKLAARLRASATQIPFYWSLSLIGRVPSKKNVKEAAGLLIRLSNLTGDTDSYSMRHDDVVKIGVLLRIDNGR